LLDVGLLVSLERRIARILLGGIIIGTLITVLRVILPNLAFVNAAILGLAVAFLIPYLFQKLEQRWSETRH
jgi:putative flippase GtrA